MSASNINSVVTEPAQAVKSTEEPRFKYFPCNYSATRNLFNKPSTSESLPIQITQLLTYKVAALFLGILETFKNIAYSIANGSIKLANVFHKLAIAPKDKVQEPEKPLITATGTAAGEEPPKQPSALQATPVGDSSVEDTKVILSAEPTVKAEVITEAEAEVITEAEAEVITEAEAEVITEAEAEVITEAEAEVITEAEAEVITEAEAEVITEAEAEVITEAEAEDITEETVGSTLTDQTAGFSNKQIAVAAGVAVVTALGFYYYGPTAITASSAYKTLLDTFSIGNWLNVNNTKTI